MSYLVTVRTEDRKITYPAIGDIKKITDSAYDYFEICAVTVMVQA